jgi:hypothetical protein
VPTVEHSALDGEHTIAFTPSTGCELICFARKRNFVQEAAARWHDGQITENLSSPSRKNILLSFSPKSAAQLRPSHGG